MIHEQAFIQERARRKDGNIVAEDSAIRAEMGKLEVAEVVKYVNEWQPKENDMSYSTHYDVNRYLEETIAANSKRFIDHLEVLVDLRNDSIGWAIAGLHRGIREQNLCSWPRVMDFIIHAYRKSLQPSEVATNPLHLGSNDPSIEVRKSVFSLLNFGLYSTECPIPDDLLDRVLDIIEFGLVDDDPTQASDLGVANSGRIVDATFQSVKGYAFDCLYDLLTRIDTSETLFSQFWSSIRKKLERYLEDTASHRFVAHYSIGRIFPIVRKHDPECARKYIDVIFPLSESKWGYFIAAWEGYVRWSPSTELFAELRTYYYHVFSNVVRFTIKPDGDVPTILQRTASHIVVECARGTLSFVEENSLLASFFTQAPTALRTIAVRTAGHLWPPDWGPERGTTAAASMQSLYEWRMAQSHAAGNSVEFFDELWGIETWPSDGFFDQSWWLDKIIEILTTWREIPAHPRFAEYLPACATQFPEKVLTITELVIESKRPAWAMLSIRRYLIEVFKNIHAVDANHRPTIQKLVNRLSTQGVVGFDEFLV